jgi:hypothetical protein
LLGSKFNNSKTAGMIVDKDLPCNNSSPLGKCWIKKEKNIWLKTMGGATVRYGRVHTCFNGSCKEEQWTSHSAGLGHWVSVGTHEHNLIQMGWWNRAHDSVGSILFSDDPGSKTFNILRTLEQISFDFTHYADDQYTIHTYQRGFGWERICEWQRGSGCKYSG